MSYAITQTGIPLFVETNNQRNLEHIKDYLNLNILS